MAGSHYPVRPRARPKRKLLGDFYAQWCPRCGRETLHAPMFARSETIDRRYFIAPDGCAQCVADYYDAVIFQAGPLREDFADMAEEREELPAPITQDDVPF